MNPISGKTRLMPNNNSNKPLIRQTLTWTTPRLTIARTTPNTDNSNINRQLTVILIIDLSMLSSEKYPTSNVFKEISSQLSQ
jgi:hypothetical protein